MSWDVLAGRNARADYYDPDTWEVFLQVGDIMDQAALDRLDLVDLTAVEAQLHGLSLDAVHSSRWIGWGRYKSTVARAVLRPGAGDVLVNGQPVRQCFQQSPVKARRFLQRLLVQGDVSTALADLEGVVRVVGSTPSSVQQPKAVTHAVAKALAQYDPRLSSQMKRIGFGGVRVKRSERFG